jgi:hypothetical protein
MTAPSEEQSQKLSSIEPYDAPRAAGHTRVRNVSRIPLKRMRMSSVGTWSITVRLEESAGETRVEVRVQNLSDLR